MSRAPDAGLQAVIAAQLARHFGLDTLSLGDSLLTDALRERQRTLGAPTLGAYADRLAGNAAECEALGQLLLVSQTWFDRDPLQLEALDRLLRSGSLRAPVTVWSAPCASGEECYSIAARFLRAGWAPGDFEVIGLDLSSTALARAHSRCFPRNAWRQRTPLPDWLLPHGNGTLEVAPEIANAVRLQRCNLAQPRALAGLPPAQIAFSRNFFIYLTAPARAQWLDSLAERLAAGGWLFTGPGETVSAWDGRFALSDWHPYVFQLQAPVPQLRLPMRAPSTPPRVTRPAPIEIAPIPAPPVAPLPSARELADRGRTREALQALIGELGAREPTADDFALKATLLLAHGQRHAAGEALKRALYLDPRHDDTRLLIAAMRQAAPAGRPIGWSDEDRS